MQRRKFLAAVTGTVPVSAAGCLGFRDATSNVYPDGDAVAVDPETLLVAPDELPEEDRNPWVELDRESTDSRARQRLVVENDHDVPSTSKFWRYLVVRVEVFDDVDEAKAEYETTARVFDPGIAFWQTSDSGLGDEGLFYAPNADDTHLIVRENNVFVDIVEMEGTDGAGDVVKAAGQACLSRLADADAAE